MMVYRLPLNEVVFDFYDRLKSISRGYASFDYQIDGYEEGDVVLLNILVNSEPVDALALIVHRGTAENAGEHCASAEGPHPAAALPDRHSGGDRRPHHRARDGQGLPQGRAGQMLRRRHYEKAQIAREAEGRRKRMRQFGKVEIPQSAFLAALKMGDS